MKFLVVFAAVVLAINAATDVELWSEFKKTHGKEYRSFREERERFTIFQQSLRKIEEHNAKYENGESTYYLGVNQFADMTSEEFRNMLNYSRAAKPAVKLTSLHQMSGVQRASSVNWVSQGVVTGVKDQGNCGSCWAFSAVGSIEGQYAIHKNTLVSLSEQNLLDCSTQNSACDGGVMDYAFDYVKANGIEKTSDYPYKARKGSCAFSKSKSVLKVSGHTGIPSGNENSLQDAISSVGPVSVAVNADNYQHYSGGVFDDRSCSNKINHGVLAVGYGTQSNTDYYLIKNSWGTNWGEKGYIKMARNKNSQCGITVEASYPHIA